MPYVISVFLTLFFALGAQAQQPVPNIEGDWTIKAVRGAPGVYTQENMDRAAALVGSVISVRGKEIDLFEGKKCFKDIVAAQRIDDYGFGSARGSWENIGLIPTEPNGLYYHVYTHGMYCPPDGREDPLAVEPEWEYEDRDRYETYTIYQTQDRNLAVLGIGAVWVELEKNPADPAVME